MRWLPERMPGLLRPFILLVFLLVLLLASQGGGAVDSPLERPAFTSGC